METLLAARLQMTLSLAFHMVFAAIGIGLPLMLVLVERAYLKTGQEHYKALAHKWAKATGLLFAVGAVSGTALSFELGLLWPRYMEVLGAVVGHMFALEGFAFFIEAIFIGIYLYGWERVSPKAHWWCGVAIALSGAISGFLILGVNAWMQLPIGFDIEQFKQTGRVLVSDPIATYKRAGWLYMSIHSTLSCYMAVGFAVAGVYAWGWLRGRRDAYHRTGMRVGLAVGGICAVLQPLSGDLLAKFVFATQPAKFAAMEGQFRTESRAPLRIGGIPDTQAMETRYAVEIPGGLSMISTWRHDPDTVVPGLDGIDRAYWPNVHITHFAFQVMVGLGVLLMALSVWFWIAWWRRKERSMENRAMLWAILLAGPLGFVALEAGWVVTEVGRQPWVIQNVMLTRDAVTSAAGVVPTFYAFTLLYIVLGVAVIALLLRLADPPEAGLAIPRQPSPQQ